MESWFEIGERIRQARIANRLSQAELATKVAVDRSALARIEGGARHVSAVELFRLADALGLPLGHFVTRPPAAVVSRRQELTEDADQVTRARFRLDAALEAHARDADWLAGDGYLEASPHRGALDACLDPAADPAGARATARAARRVLGVPDGPIDAVADVCGRAGLHLLVVDGLEAGASLLLDDGLGVAVIGGADDPGRRRFTAAHELGHYVLKDAYSTDIGVAASKDEREQRIDAFAAEFLLPQDVVAGAWQSSATRPERQRLIELAGTYRVSWSLVLRAAVGAGVLSSADASAMRARSPQRGDFLEVLGHQPADDLPVGTTSELWRRAAFRAWRSGVITSSRTVELLHGVIGADDLPEREDVDLP